MYKLFERLDRRYLKVCTYAGVTVVITVAACALLFTASPVFATIWQLICEVGEPLVYGAALSYVLNPLVRRVSKWLCRLKPLAGPENGRRRRSVAVIVSIVLVALFIMAILGLFALMVTQSIASLRWDAFSDLLGDATGDLSLLLAEAESQLEEWGILTADSEATLLTTFNSVRSAASTMLFAVIFGIYLLFDGPRVSAYLARVIRAVLGRHAMDPSRQIADADRVFSGYFRGQGIDALVVGVSSGILLTIIGVPYGPVVGLLAGLGNLIPYVGGPVGFASIALMCVPSAAWDKMVWGFVVMALIMFVDANVINPRLLSNNVEVHPILVIAALIAGGAVGGIAGMLVAVPAVAWIKIQVDRWVEAREAESARKQEEDGSA